jgi:hypothetical protein
MGKDKDKKTGDKPSGDSGNVGGLKRLGFWAVIGPVSYPVWESQAAISGTTTAVEVGKAAVDAYRGDAMKSAAPKPGSK